jgi:hypothetical protein
MVSRMVRAAVLALTWLAVVGSLLAAPPAAAQQTLDEPRSVLGRFMDAVIARDAAAAGALVTEELRAPSPEALIGVSNPCAYRYEVLAFTPASPGTMAARVRHYEHFWPGDVAGGPPTSYQREVTLVQTPAGWRVARVGPHQNARQEPNEPHGPTTSACNVGRRPGVWLAAPGALPKTGAGPGVVVPGALLAAFAGLLLGAGLRFGQGRRSPQ